jgi:hypothetical protein
VDEPAQPTTAEKVEAWRLHVLLEAGYPLALAEKISERWSGAAAIDLHAAVELVESGCTPYLAAEILL